MSTGMTDIAAPPRRRTITQKILLSVAAAVTLVLCTAATAQAEIDRRAAVERYDAAVADVLTATDHLKHLSAKLANSADAVDRLYKPAEDAIAAAAGKVLDESGRNTLTAHIAEARQDQAEARELAVTLEGVSVRTAIDAKNHTWTTPELVKKYQQLGHLFPTASPRVVKLDGWAATFTADQAKIAEQVKAWEAEQARIAAEKAAQEAARKAAAAKRGGGGGAQAAPGGGRVWTIYVRGWANGADMQRLIDTGGQWATNFGSYGVIVAAHNWSDARALSVRDGDIVQFTGAIGGRYVARGFVNVPTSSPVSVITPLGAQMHLQTCYWHNGRTKVVGLFPA